MKATIFFTVMLVSIAIEAAGQGSSTLDTTPYFSAVIVNNVDSSMQWYQSVLGLKVKNRIDDPAMGAKVVILESAKILIELLELKGSMVPKEIVKGRPEGTRIQGHFKIGFKVASIDSLLKHLSGLKIRVDRVYTDSATGKRNFLIEDPNGNLIQFFD